MIRSMAMFCVVLLLGIGCSDSDNDTPDNSEQNQNNNDPSQNTGRDPDEALACLAALPVNTIEESEIEGDTHWTSGIYILKDSLTVTGGVLKVDPCSKIVISNNGILSIRDNGALSLSGTEDGPILITSSKSSPQAGDWNQIEFYPSGDSGNNKLDHVVIEYGGGGSYGAIWLEEGAQAAISNSVIRKSKDYGIVMEDGAHLKSFAKNSLINNELGPIKLYANSVDDLGEGTYKPNAADGIQVVNGYVTHDAIWRNLGTPYIAESGFVASVESGSAHVTLQAGIILKLGDNATIAIQRNGGLTIAGTEAEPVKITSAKSSPQAGDWKYIEFYKDSSRGFNKIDHGIIEFGGHGDYGSIWVQSEADLHIKNTTIQNSADFGLELENGAKLLEFTGNKLINNARGPIILGANAVDSLGVGTYQGNMVEGIQIREEAVTHDSTWLNLDAPYVAEKGFSAEVESGSAVVSLNPGTTLKLGAGAEVSINKHGGLTLNGTAENHVKITSAKSAPLAGDWNQINIYSGSNGAKNVFDYTDISYGGGGDYGQLWVDSHASIVLNNTTFSNGKECDVDKEDEANVAGGSLFTICN